MQLEYVNKATRCLYQIFYFALSVTWGYFILHKTRWLPWFLGGQNPQSSIVQSFEMDHASLPSGFHVYIFTTMGYHISSFMELLFASTRKNDFREMLLHHITTCTLYLGFIYSNILGVGGVIAWLHDLADVFVALSRFLNCLGFENEASFVFWVMYVVWVYTRMVVLPIYIYNIKMHASAPSDRKEFDIIIYYMTTLLCLLQLMHMYWFVLLSKVGIKLASLGKS